MRNKRAMTVALCMAITVARRHVFIVTLCNSKLEGVVNLPVWINGIPSGFFLFQIHE